MKIACVASLVSGVGTSQMIGHAPLLTQCNALLPTHTSSPGKRTTVETIETNNLQNM